MPAPATAAEFIDLVRKSGLLDDATLAGFQARRATPAGDAKSLADSLVVAGMLTSFQAGLLLKGRWKNFVLAGKYRLLDHLGTGGMGSVFLCEHMVMQRRVAVKVLPGQNDRGAVDRFKREARAAAALDHPNIVRAHDIDSADGVHFLIMEYVDGVSLQQLLATRGPLSVERACHYIAQSAIGLHHAHEAGLVHRDVKPGNLLLDRTGTVKVLDMGLARFERADDGLTQQHDQNAILGTADYLAPEQALDSSAVDRRADVYALGATFFFLLAGRTPFGEGPVSQKIIRHQSAPPPSVRKFRPEVPAGVAAIVERMLAKDPAKRYQSALAVAEALAPWTKNPIPPPSAEEIPARAGGPHSGAHSAAHASGFRSMASRPLLPAGSSLTGRRAVKRRRIWPWAIAFALLVLVATGATFATLRFLVPEEQPQTFGPPARPFDTTAPVIRKPGEPLPVPANVREARRYVGLPGGPARLAVSAEGGALAAGGDDGVVRFWQAEGPDWPHDFKGHAGPALAAALDRTGRRLASGGQDGTVRAWDTEARKQAGSWDGKGGPVRAVALSPDGNWIVAGSDDGIARLWGFDGKLRHECRGHTAAVLAADWLADGRFFLTASADRTVRLWQADKGEEIRRFEGPTDRVTALAAIGLHAVLAGSADGSARVFDLRTGAELRRLAAGGPAVAVSASEDGNRLAVAAGRAVRVWGPGSVVAEVGLPADVSATALLPDGTRLLTAAYDRSFVQWQTEPPPTTPWANRAYAGNAGPVERLAASPDGRLVATAGQDKTVRVWDVASGRQAHVFTGHAERVLWVAFAPDSSRVASVGGEGALRTWDVAGRKPLLNVPAHQGNAWGVAWSPDGKLLLTGGADNVARLWDATTGAPVRDLTGHAGNINAVTFSPDSKLAATASWDRTVRLWDVASGKEVRRFEGHTQNANAVAFSPDGRLVLTGCTDLGVRLFDAADGTLLHVFAADKAAWSVSFSADGRRLAASGDGQEIRFWDVATRRRVATARHGWPTAPAGGFLPDGTYLSGGYDRTVLRWEFAPAAGTPFAAMLSPEGPCALTSVATAEAKVTAVAAGGLDGVVSLWDPLTCVRTHEFRGHTKAVRAVAVDGTANFAASGGDDGTIRLWDVALRQEVRVLPGHGKDVAVRGLGFLPGGRHLVSGGADGRLIVWDRESGSSIRQFAAHSDAVEAVAVLPGSRRFATAGADRSLRLWDADTGELRRFEGIGGPVRAVAASPDGSRLISAEGERTVRIWDVGSGKPIFAFEGDRRVGAVAFSTDGRLALVASGPRVLRWDLAEGGRPLQSLRRHPNAVAGMALLSGGRLLTAAHDGLCVWETP